MNGFYRDMGNAMVTSISGGRKHFSLRPRAVATETYKYHLEEGENLYELAREIFGDEEWWWILGDLNGERQNGEYEAFEEIILPEEMVEYRGGINRLI